MPKIPSVCWTVFLCPAVPLSIPFQHVLCPTWLISLECIKWAIFPLKFWLSSSRGKHQQEKWGQKNKHGSIHSCNYFSKYVSYDPMDCNPSGFSVHGILQARILEWVDSHSLTPEDLPDPGIKPRSPALQTDSLSGKPSWLFFSPAGSQQTSECQSNCSLWVLLVKLLPILSTLRLWQCSFGFTSVCQMMLMLSHSVVWDSLWPHALEPTSLLSPWGFSKNSARIQYSARILEWVDMPSSRGSSQPRDQTQLSHSAGRFFTVWATREVSLCQSLLKFSSVAVTFF